MAIQKITSGIIQDGAIAAADIVSVSNTAISGLIQAAQIGSANASLVTSGTLPAARLPAGSVLQVKSTTKTDTFTMSGATLTDVTGLSVAITPINSANKIYVVFSLTIAGTSGGGGAVYQLVRGSTDIAEGDANGSRPRLTGAAAYIANTNVNASVGGNFLDSPATTSSTTYKLQVAAASGAVSVFVNRSETYGNTSDNYSATFVSTITVMEIAG